MEEQLTAIEKKRLKALLKGEVWDLIVKFANLKIRYWQKDTIAGTSAYEELKALHLRDGKVQGVEELLEQLEKQAYDQ